MNNKVDINLDIAVTYICVQWCLPLKGTSATNVFFNKMGLISTDFLLNVSKR